MVLRNQSRDNRCPLRRPFTNMPQVLSHSIQDVLPAVRRVVVKKETIGKSESVRLNNAIQYNEEAVLGGSSLNTKLFLETIPYVFLKKGEPSSIEQQVIPVQKKAQQRVKERRKENDSYSYIHPKLRLRQLF